MYSSLFLTFLLYSLFFTVIIVIAVLLSFGRCGEEMFPFAGQMKEF